MERPAISPGRGYTAHSSGNDVAWSEMTVAELKTQLKARGLPVSGVKAVLIQRLEENQPATKPAKKRSRYFTNGNEESPSAALNMVPADRGRASTRLASPSALASPKTPPRKKRSPSVTPEAGGDAMKSRSKGKSPTKGKKTPSPRKRIRIEPGSLAPPEDWQRIYKLVEELRSDRSAPVDTEGGHELPEKHLGPVVWRFQVLTALMLSSQTKDAVVGETMRTLQRHGLTVENVRRTDHERLNSLIRKVGFHNNKTKYMKQVEEILMEQYGGDIPRTAEEMMKLPGVGPKMAYIVEHVSFGTVSGIGVDTHMHRMFNDLGWVDSTTPESTREQLEGWLPRERWGEVNVLWVGFGQEVQQQKEKSLRKALACSAPKDALELVKRLKFDVDKEAKRYGLEEKIKRVWTKR